MTQDFAITRRQFLATIPVVLSGFSQTNPISSIPKPKFRLGQKVESSWICDDEQCEYFGDRLWMIGQVLGVVWDFDENQSCFGNCWSYWVEFSKTHHYLVSDIGCRLMLAEAELQEPSIDQKLI